VFKHTVTYNDFNGKEHTEDLYFHIMAPEFADLEFNPEFGGSLSDYVRDAMKSGEGAKVYTFFKMMIVNSYGRRSEDGARFVKKADFTEDFLNSNAYEEFFMWLVSNSKNAEVFWNGIMPEKLSEFTKEIEASSTKKDLKDLTKDELVAMMQERLNSPKEVSSS